jgi:ankyrin repeat protein
VKFIGPASNELVQGLISSCVIGQLDLLHGFLEQTGNVDPRSIPTAQYLLQVAAKHGQAEVVRYLFDTLPECRHQNPWTPTLPNGINWVEIPQQWSIYEDGVIFAAIEGTNPIKVFEVFFDYGMSADYNLERAISPLACAISSNYEFAKFLLQKGANPNGRYILEEDTFLGCAASSPTPDMLNLLVQHGARLQGSHALREATQYRRINNTKRLLELGTDINEVFTRPVYDPSNPLREVIWGCALHFAIKGGQLNKPITDSPTEMVRFLLEQGAQADTLDGDGKTPLQVAKLAKKRDIIQVFHEYGITE